VSRKPGAIQNTLGLAWGIYYSKITGGGGNDRLYAGTYSTTVDGSLGTDTLYLQGASKDWTAADAAGGKTYTHKASGQEITAKGIEAVAYYKATALAT
jgi:hypothetical protein